MRPGRGGPVPPAAASFPYGIDKIDPSKLTPDGFAAALPMDLHGLHIDQFATAEDTTAAVWSFNAPSHSYFYRIYYSRGFTNSAITNVTDLPVGYTVARLLQETQAAVMKLPDPKILGRDSGPDKPILYLGYRYLNTPADGSPSGNTYFLIWGAGKQAKQIFLINTGSEEDLALIASAIATKLKHA